jgi:hypothetical protein
MFTLLDLAKRLLFSPRDFSLTSCKASCFIGLFKRKPVERFELSTGPLQGDYSDQTELHRHFQGTFFLGYLLIWGWY